MTRDIIANLRAKHPAAKDVGLRGAVPKSVETDRGNRLIHVIANTDDIDSDREVVLPAGAAPDSYFYSNRVVFADHDYGTKSAVGKARRWNLHPSTRDPRSWRVSVHMLDLKGNPLPDDILTMAEEGAIGVSIGFEPHDRSAPTEAETKRYDPEGKGLESVVRRWDWLELSFTPFPCNVACQTESVQRDDSKRGVMDDMLVKGKIARSTARHFGMDVRERAPARVVLLGDFS